MEKDGYIDDLVFLGRYIFIFLRDFGAILILCSGFVLLKGLYYQVYPSEVGWINQIKVSLWFGMFHAFICYPVFLIGIRITKSFFWFVLLSWGVTGVLFYHSLNHGIGLTYKINGVYARDHGHLTAFGVFYENVLTPEFFMAVLAAGLWGWSILTRSSKQQHLLGE